ncbi:cytoskeleton protein RodZ [Microbulbifer donghaiensis]|uniref:Cytoskeleton protein RodZ n=1 Tax=Microbulbifer donghaiensis TaxID=494016 RepID=A0A1M5CCI0_9GAMM|nr:RodZ domain-containing protein [Microbulbifer donghaiensis]SHF52400.1 cytoskeleton protein RodZ [Microbulbifer donghaiensis]
MTDNISEITQERPLADSEQLLDNSPGSQLRRAREKAGLSQEELSRRLCMVGNKLELLERDEYSRLPSSIYVRGYIRNACKELGIDAEPVLQAYAGYCSAEEASRNIVAHVSRSPVMPERKRSLKGLALLPLLLVGGVFWWMNGREAVPPVVIAQKPSGEDMAIAAHESDLRETGTAVAQSPAVGTEPAQALQAESPAGSDEASATVVAAAPAQEEPGAGNFTEMAASASAPEEDVAADEPVVAEPAVTAAVSGAEVAEMPDAEVPAASFAAAVVEELQLNFDEEAWVEVKDASGAVLLAKLQAAGSETVLTGQPPFDLMLGNASGTHVRYQGELIDSDPIGSRRTRRLTVGE